MKKVISGAADAVRDIPNGAVIAVGGFGLCGLPENLIAALATTGVTGLTCISNNAGMPEFGLGLLMQKGQIKKMIASFVGANKLFEDQVLAGKVELELNPQGTLAERMRAAGSGIAAFYTPTGVGTVIAEGKDIKEFDGRRYILERALHADYSLVKAWRGDTAGNLVFRRTARNFNPVVAMCGRVTIAEVEELVPAGSIDPDQVHVPGIYVKRIFEGKNYIKPIENRTVRAS